MPKENLREHILDVASQIAREAGAANITIEAVAKRAGIGKGGVMYHFETKSTLLKALVDRVVDAGLVKAKNRELQHQGQRSPMLSSWIDEGLNLSSTDLSLYSGLLGAVSHDPELAQPARNAYRLIYGEFQNMGDMAPNALVVALALDGLLFLRLLKLVDIDVANTDRLRAVLKRLAESPLSEPVAKRISKLSKVAPVRAKVPATHIKSTRTPRSSGKK